MAQDYVVIDSSVDTVKPGATLVSGAVIDVPEGGRIVLITASGGVKLIAGPFHGPLPKTETGSAPSGGSQIVDAMAGLFRNPDRRGEPYVARGMDWRTEMVKTRDDVLAIDASDGGDMCVLDQGAAALIHDPDRPGAMMVQSESGPKATVEWKKGVLRQPWPWAVPLADGELYLFEQAQATSVATAIVHVLKLEPAADDVRTAAQMAASGCRDQALLLLALVAKSAK